MARRLARGRRVAGTVLATAVIGIGVSACGSSNPDARSACVDVYRSLRTYDASLADRSAAARAAAEQRALTELRAALAPAAAAGSQYQALTATITESPSVPEGTLEPALEAQCAAATATGSSGSTGGGGVPIAGSVPPRGAGTSAQSGGSGR